MKIGSGDFLDYSRNFGRMVLAEDESGAEELAQKLLVLERQQRIYERLAAFEREREAFRAQHEKEGAA